MIKGIVVRVSVAINAPAERVWDALINPALINQYLFGTDVTSDWKAGSPITYRGEWKGKTYEDKGTIIEIEPQKRLVSTFWSSLSGMADIEENYKTVSYELSAGGNTTTLTLTQENNSTQEEADHSEQNWKMVLNTLKEILEKTETTA